MRNIKVCLINFNQLTFEMQHYLDLKLPKDKEEGKLLLKEIGLIGNLDNDCDFEIANRTIFYYYIINKIFPEYMIKDNQHKNFKYKGEPDFVLTNKNSNKDIIYLEIKWENDGINYNQFNWMLKNKNTSKIKILYLDFLDLDDLGFPIRKKKKNY